MVSLLLSWVTAVTVTPLLCVLFLKGTKTDGGNCKILTRRAFYLKYKALLHLWYPETLPDNHCGRSDVCFGTMGILVRRSEFFPGVVAATIHVGYLVAARHAY